jgi:protein gp37
MGATGIEWTRGPNGEPGFTFNPWIGCTKVSAACDNCYAEVCALKMGVTWGPHGVRKPVSESAWAAVEALNRRAARLGCRFRVFCASMADVLDNHPSIPQSVRDRLYALIEATPHLDWMLLTKRPQNAKKLLPYSWFMRGGWPKNAWFGFTAEDGVEFRRRWAHAKQVPAPVLFVSAEPLFESYELPGDARQIGLFIVGGESGKISNCRPTPQGAFEHMRMQCSAMGIPFFMKQLDQVSYRGLCIQGWLPGEPQTRRKPRYKHFDSFPDSLRVRDQPRISA